MKNQKEKLGSLGGLKIALKMLSKEERALRVPVAKTLSKASLVYNVLCFDKTFYESNGFLYCVDSLILKLKKDVSCAVKVICKIDNNNREQINKLLA